MAANPTSDTSMPLFRALFEAHFGYVWHALRRLGVFEADREDLANEVFFRVHRALETFDVERPPRPWLFAFAVRVASEHRRLARHRAEVLTEPLEDSAPVSAPEDKVERAERRAILAAAMDALDLDKRAVFVMHDLEELGVPEIARALGIPEGTAYSRLRAARAEVLAAVRRIQAQTKARRSTGAGGERRGDP